jgi:hypothetical protein
MLYLRSNHLMQLLIKFRVKEIHIIHIINHHYPLKFQRGLGMFLTKT